MNENPMIQELIEMFQKIKREYPLGYIVEAYKEVIEKEIRDGENV